MNKYFCDYYDLLDVHYANGDEYIRNKYLALVKQWHPDVNPSRYSNLVLKMLNVAYSTLTNPDTKFLYLQAWRAELPDTRKSLWAWLAKKQAAEIVALAVVDEPTEPKPAPVYVFEKTRVELLAEVEHDIKWLAENNHFPATAPLENKKNWKRYYGRRMRRLCALRARVKQFYTPLEYLDCLFGVIENRILPHDMKNWRREWGFYTDMANPLRQRMP